MSVDLRRVATAIVFSTALSAEVGDAPLRAAGQAVDARQLKMEGFAPVSGAWTKKNGKQVRFVGIAYREKETQGGSEATGTEIRTWGYGTEGRYERMVPFTDIKRLVFVQCGDRFEKGTACANVESLDGTVHLEEAFRSDYFSGKAWLFLVLRISKGRDVEIALGQSLKNGSIEFDG